ncbi:MAG: HDOD domain-containing protein [Deltaproteobacteria bacterium]|nr:HDOD domain-containing protein [Deltaproteobacteria bacterium]
MTASDQRSGTGAAAQPGVFFTKQPILDKQRRIWGYELLGAELGEGGIYKVFSQRESSASVSSTAYLGLQDAMDRGKKVAVAFDAKSIIDGVPHVLPPGHGVLRALAGAGTNAGVLDALQSMRQEGYLVSMDMDPGTVDYEMCSQADILCQEFATAKVNGLGMRAAMTKTQLLVRGVQTIEQFEKAKDMGFHLYQGSFFKEPEPMPGRKLSSSHAARINLFRLMESEDPDFKALAAAISSDVSISFRLLSYLNSPYFGLMRKIQSIDQAITLLGWNKLKIWLRAVILADMAGQEEIPLELASLSLQRAKFFELLSTEYDWWGFNSSTLFLVGIFSLLDVILGMEMSELTEKLPLDPKLKAALRRDANSEYLPLFHLLSFLEDGEWAALEDQTQQLGLDMGMLKSFHVQARDWAEAFFSTLNKG